MLQELRVKNYALIRELNFAPGKSLNVITGETGAGKSIILGALGLVLGNRADMTALMNKEEKCIIEAEFLADIAGLKEFFEESDLDFSNQIIIRREITPTGKSRIFVNDTPTTLQITKQLGEKLIEIHTQHTGLLITEPFEQLHVLDQYAVNKALLSEYTHKFKQANKLEQTLKRLEQEQEEFNREKDYFDFLYQELSEFGPKIGEQAELDEEIEKLSHASEISESCQQAAFMLTENENSVYSHLSKARQILKKSQQYHKGISAIEQGIGDILITLKEMGSDLTQISESTEGNPRRLEELESRQAAMQLLLRKHQLSHNDELVDKMNSLEQLLTGNLDLTKEIEEIHKEIKSIYKECKELALRLHEVREKAAAAISKEAAGILQSLEMPDAQLVFHLAFQPENLNATGSDQVSILFTANKGGKPQSLEKVASGGEVSRLNFCLKSLLAGKKQMPTMIFDETDTGVSGEVAGKMGELMRKLSATHQIIAITHLPQVAASGNEHYFVYKSEFNGKTSSAIKKLNSEERIEAIAQMLSGKNPGEAALANARELLGMRLQ